MWRSSATLALCLVMQCSIAAPGFYAASEQWVTSKHQIDGKAAAVRLNAALPALVTRGEFGRSLKFIVPFNVHNDRPFPERLDREDLEKIEEAIESHLIDPGVAIFATIVTVNNAREFLLYVADMEQAQALAEQLVAEIKTHAISFRLKSDPHWEAWSKFTSESYIQR